MGISMISNYEKHSRLEMSDLNYNISIMSDAWNLQEALSKCKGARPPFSDAGARAVQECVSDAARAKKAGWTVAPAAAPQLAKVVPPAVRHTRRHKPPQIQRKLSATAPGTKSRDNQTNITGA